MANPMYTDRFRRSMQYARETSNRLGHNYVGHGHLLLAIIQEEQSTASVLLHKMGLDLGTLRPIIEESIPPKVEQNLGGQYPPFTPQTKELILHSIQLAQSIQKTDDLRSVRVGTEHLLLTLAKESQEKTGELLVTNGVRYEQLIEKVQDR